jgi:pimeloyl-ACP methyl ester carboxylesterase
VRRPDRADRWQRLMRAETRYAKSGDTYIAYQVFGDGPLDLVVVPSSVTHLEHLWEEPAVDRFRQRLASFSRFITFDKRGMGLSDRVTGVPTLEERMDDVRAVMDTVGSDRAAVMGSSEGGPMAAVFAATYPERTTALVLYGTYASMVRTPDYPWRPTRDEVMLNLENASEMIAETWGRVADVSRMAPSHADDDRFKQWWTALQRLGASPGAVLALMRMNAEIDIRHVLPSIHVPTLVLHRTGDRVADVGEGRYLAASIPGAKFVELPGRDHLPFVGDTDAILSEIEEFLTGARHAPEPDRALATILFTDIVGSTERAAELGDRRWRDLLDGHNTLVRRELNRFRGREIQTTGDGFHASFDGPARAIRCACAINSAVRQLGIAVRAGLHTGEVEIMGNNLGGVAVHIGARVAAQAEAREVLVSSTVRDLVAGSGIRFEDRGTRVLKGIPGEWRVFAVDCPG